MNNLNVENDFTVGHAMNINVEYEFLGHPLQGQQSN